MDQADRLIWKRFVAFKASFNSSPCSASKTSTRCSSNSIWEAPGTDQWQHSCRSMRGPIEITLTSFLTQEPCQWNPLLIGGSIVSSHNHGTRLKRTASSIPLSSRVSTFILFGQLRIGSREGLRQGPRVNLAHICKIEG